MRLVTMLRDVLSALFSKPATTPYPNPEPQPSERLRGQLHWAPAQCTGCQLCVKDCPSNAIQLLTLDKANKQFVMVYDAAQCTFCGQCVQNCRFDCISMSDEEWSMATANKETLLSHYGHGEQDVLEKQTENTTKAEQTVGNRGHWA